jgi:hypothetical protein
MRTRLDRSIYHSSVHGEFDDPVRFWQDGLPFDTHGELVESKLTGEQSKQLEAQRARGGAKAAAPPPEVAAPPPEAPPVGEFAGIEPEQSAPSDPPLADQENDVNLELWLKGERKYQSGRVFAAARARFNKAFTNYADLVDFLVYDARLMTANEVTARLRPKDENPVKGV